MNHKTTPLFTKLSQFSQQEPISYHVPGHKNGAIFPKNALNNYDKILPLDLTELTGLDDLHAPSGVIAEAEELAADFFGADHTFFLVGGSTVGNLAMILAVCNAGEKIIVQRNSHKSIINGLELSGAMPVFINPEYDKSVGRYTAPNLATLKQAFQENLDAKAVVLTYPDYFGKTYAIKQMIETAHEYNVPVLVDEAHGVHFSLGEPFPPSTLKLGADVVVQSAHKMAPAMTMSSFLHITSTRIATESIAHYLQMLQSSSPSYPLMASLDIARSFLAQLTPIDVDNIQASVYQLRELMQSNDFWDLLPYTETDDLLKLTLHVKQGLSGHDVAQMFEKEGIFPELATHNQVLFVQGLAPFKDHSKLRSAIKRIKEQLKIGTYHATIDIGRLFTKPMQKLALSYQTMNQLQPVHVPLKEGIGYVAAEAIIPYPPGIPFILKGETITANHIEIIEQLLRQGVTIQHRDLNKGIGVFKGEEVT
ncbi:aminotransferase class I/II-fold pyridoxal phosphate-dependent enzyme [Virgibacillus ndiopensis]|uniref:aminotransferase class I/II-fold pyridoxal phosphate-dependent enzyme n=1 Tax=Virgibacillus ndiopensis TaxID=2004408 RepID=UPI000C0796EF|nr:aminotransferase class I/II-fold pyridoxal phosphate-dependent enzyme [Virgibacillus ndiopensis]